MTQSSTTTKVQYAGDGGTTAFSTVFTFTANAHVVVIHTTAAGIETTWVEGTQYTIDAVAGTGVAGTVTVGSGIPDYTPASGTTLTIKRVPPFTQLTDLPLGGALQSSDIESMSDLTVEMIQSLAEEMDRSIKVPEASAANPSTLPILTDRANKYFTWDSSGNPTATDAATASGTSVLATGSTTARLLADRFADVYNVLDYGAVGDGVTDDRAAVQSAHDAAEAAGGGVVFYPPGTYLFATATTGSTALNWDGNDVYHEGCGAGVSIIKLADGADLHLFNIDTVTRGGIRGLEINGNRANQTTAGHGIRLATVTDFVIEDFYIHDAFTYGIGWSQAGTSTNVHVRRGLIEDTGADGIDVKNVDDANSGCSITDVTIKRFGRLNTKDLQVGIDVRGPMVLNNINVSDYGDVAGATSEIPAYGGIRFRDGELLATNGLGGHYSSLTGFNCSPGASTTITVGVACSARNCQIYGGQVDGCDIGVLVTDIENNITNVAAVNSITDGFKLDDTSGDDQADRCILTGCTSRDSAADGFEIEGDGNQLIGCISRDNVTGFQIDAGAVGTVIIGGEAEGNSGNAVNDSGTSSVFVKLAGYVTENSGTDAIVSGATSKAVTHGLSVTPALQDIAVTLVENATNDHGPIYVTAVGATTFTVNCRADPGASNLSFGWRAVSKKV